MRSQAALPSTRKARLNRFKFHSRYSAAAFAIAAADRVVTTTLIASSTRSRA
jgi:hypothetical protein